MNDDNKDRERMNSVHIVIVSVSDKANTDIVQSVPCPVFVDFLLFHNRMSSALCRVYLSQSSMRPLATR